MGTDVATQGGPGREQGHANIVVGTAGRELFCTALLVKCTCTDAEAERSEVGPANNDEVATAPNRQ